MYNVSNDFIEAVKSAGRQVDVIVETANEIITYDKITSISLNQCVSVPGTAIKSLNLSLVGNVSIDEIKSVKVGVLVNDAYEYIDFGRFFIATEDSGNGYNADTDSTIVIAYDGMVKTMSALQETPQTTDDESEERQVITLQTHIEALAALLSEYGITLETPDKYTGYTVYADDLTGLTYRDLLQFIAEAECGFFVCSGDTIEFKGLTPVANPKIDGGDLKKLSISKSGIIGNVTFSNDGLNHDIVAESGTIEVNISGNPIVEYMTKNALTDELNALDARYKADLIDKQAYTALEMETFGAPWIEAGDAVTAIDPTSNAEYVAWATDITLTIDGGMSQTLTSSLVAEKTDIDITDNSQKIENLTSEVSKVSTGLRLKVSKGDVVSEINQSPDTISLRANRIEIDSDKFKLTTDGDVTAESGTIAGFTMDDKALSKTFNINGANYTFEVSSNSGSDTTTPLISIMEDDAGEYIYLVDTRGNSELNDLIIHGKMTDIYGNNVLEPYNAYGHIIIGNSEVKSDASESRNCYVCGKFVKFRSKGEELEIVKDGSTSRAIFRPSSNGNGYIGDSSHRWQTVYSVNGVNTSSDRKLKKDIKSLNPQEAKAFVLGLNPVQYKFIDGERVHTGLVAQEVNEVAKKTLGDISACQASVIGDDGEVLPFKSGVSDDKLLWSLNYSELIAPLLAVVQEQEKRINELERKLSNAN